MSKGASASASMASKAGTAREVKMEPEEGGAPASIARIHMKNFMSYKDVSVELGPGFNVVVGPNGAGKSSIVSAIGNRSH